MVEEPDRIRDDISTTRASLSRDVDQLADRTIPARVARRRWDGVKDKVRGASERVMGQPKQASEAASDVADSVRQAPRAVARQTRGNPIAVGVIAFGVGLLTASLIPATEAEKRAGQQLRENAEDLVDQVREPLAESVQQVRADLSGSVREAAGQVKETAKEAAQTTAEDAKASTRDAAEQTLEAAREAP
jgi:gas vesicle protein